MVAPAPYPQGIATPELTDVAGFAAITALLCCNHCALLALHALPGGTAAAADSRCASSTCFVGTVTFPLNIFFTLSAIIFSFHSFDTTSWSCKQLSFGSCSSKFVLADQEHQVCSLAIHLWVWKRYISSSIIQSHFWWDQHTEPQVFFDWFCNFWQIS